ncbi:hypothetical protein KKF34_02755 [Myxococcota bacterium]|nr:hypothetical protein [Myxococcota bacterium]MBU1383017.1 hypothetical protein [Myxococcota bacterium]MBU1495782.1 hypothetical protein [Myxococcota bacterium]
MNYAIYIVILVGFIAVFFFMKKFQSNMTAKAEAAMDANAEAIAISTGMSWERLEKPEGKNILSGGGARIWGQYKGHETEIKWYNWTKYYTQGSKNIWEWWSDNKIVVSSSKSGENWSIAPRKKGETSMTGVPAFDKNLVITGNHSLTAEDLAFLGGFSWMKLNMREGSLVFVDDYYTDIQKEHGYMAVTSAIHPVWFTSAKNPAVSVDSVVNFLDFMVYVAA